MTTEGRGQAGQALAGGEIHMGAEAVVHTIRQPVLLMNEDLSVALANDAFYRQFGLEPDATLGHRLFDLANGQWDIPGLRDRMERAQAHGEPFEAFEAESHLPGLGRRTLAFSGRQIEPLSMIVLAIDDVTPRSTADRPDAATRELQRRVRNSFATMRSLVARTAAHSDDLGGFLEALDGRFNVLTRIQGLALRTQPQWIDLHELVLDEFNAYEARVDGNLDLDGRDVWVEPHAAQALGFAIHELITNSVKYGALSTNGRIQVRWHLLEGGDDGPRLRLDWMETGVPTDAEPGPPGLGRRMIEESIPYELGGEARLEIAPPTVTCRLEIPCEGWITPAPGELGNS